MYRNSFMCGTEYIDNWKIFIPEAVGSGNMKTDILKPILGKPLTACTETYVMNGPYRNEIEAQNAMLYIKTKFFHFMLGLKKNTQHTTKQVYQFVPMQNFTDNSDIAWGQSVSDIDKQLYKKYNLSQEEINFIESMIRPME